jgi:nucleoside ABC transporter membrane protein
MRKVLLPLANTALALLLAFALGAVAMWLSGYDPLLSYKSMLLTPLLDQTYLLSALAFSAPILLTGLTFAIGLKAGLFNIGAEGQGLHGRIGGCGSRLFG